MIVLTCIRCKQFVSIVESPNGKRCVRIFELIHKKHPLVHVNTTEIDGYNKIDEKIDKFLTQGISA